jgi:hypothetical protein
MRRFWIAIEPLPYASNLNLGCGVTAETEEEAVAILLERAAASNDAVSIRSITLDVDVSTLDDRHVLPNVGNIFRKGIWWPQGYGDS